VSHGSPRRFFVTGTDTGVGKTRCAAALCRAFAARGLAVAAMKPIASGCERTADGLRNGDALALQAAMTVRARYDEVNPYAFEPAIAPHVAARLSGVRIDLSLLDRAFERLALRSDTLVVEGAGGWRVPVTDEVEFADLAARWSLQVILVVGLKLGCINHALLTQESVLHRQLGFAGWICNRIDPHMPEAQASIETLRRRLIAPCLGDLPWAPGETADLAGRRLEVDQLAGT